MESGFDSLSPSMKIFSGNSNKSLALDICEYLNKDLGKLKFEGKDYKVNDGDIITFRFNF